MPIAECGLMKHAGRAVFNQFLPIRIPQSEIRDRLMAIRNVLICTAQVPFTTGGAESHVEGLRRALSEAGYNAEVAALPFKWYPPAEIMRGTLAWRMLDETEAN